MNKKTMLLLLTGFCAGVTMQESLDQLRWRTVSFGGELFIVPMMILLIWFGWTLRSEFKKSNVRRFKNDITRRK